MTLNLDFSADYTLWDLAEPVTFTSVRSAGDVPLTVETALRGQPGYKERAPTGGVYAAADVKWLLPGPLLSGLQPKPGDTVTDAANVRWTLLQPGYDQLDQVWDCYAIALSIVHSLADSLTVWAPTNNQDPAGSRLPSFSESAGPFDARFQLTSEEVEEARGKQLWKRTYDAYVAGEVTVSSEHQVRDGVGNVYQVVSYRNRGRIDELSVVTCVRYSD